MDPVLDVYWLTGFLLAFPVKVKGWELRVAIALYLSFFAMGGLMLAGFETIRTFLEWSIFSGGLVYALALMSHADQKRMPTLKEALGARWNYVAALSAAALLTYGYPFIIGGYINYEMSLLDYATTYIALWLGVAVMGMLAVAVNWSLKHRFNLLSADLN